MKGYFITATDTDAGKTFVTAGLLHALSQLSYKTIGLPWLGASLKRMFRGMTVPKSDFLKYLRICSRT